MDSEGNSHLADKDPGKLKIGDSVRCDKVRNVLKKNPWQPAIVTMMDNNTVTLKLNNGEKSDVNMRSQYRGKFKQGDQVIYKKSSEQIKKSNLQKLEEEWFITKMHKAMELFNSSQKNSGLYSIWTK